MALLKSGAYLVLQKNAASYMREANVNLSRYVRFYSVSSASEPSTLSELLLNKYQFSPEAVSYVSSALTQLKNPKNPDLVLTFLKNSGFSNAQLEKLLKFKPRFLSADIERSIKPKLEICRELGFSSGETAEILSISPVILNRDVDTKVAPALSMLKGLMGSNDDVAHLVKRSRGFVISSSNKNLAPNIEYLKSCGLAMERIRRLLFNSPRFFLYKPELVRKYVEMAEKMGVDRGSNLFIYAIKVLGSMSSEIWELKLCGLRNLGFSDEDLLEIFRKAPYVFAVSVEKTKRTVDVLLATGKFTVSDIVRYPVSLCCSIERRIVPRLRILEILEEKNLIRAWPPLGTVFSLPNEKFARKYVIPYQDKIEESTWLGILSEEKV